MNADDYSTYKYSYVGRYWHRLDDGRIQCDLCPRYCKLHEGQQGLCYVRERHADKIYLTTYGRSSGFCIDPIEKKPLNHYYPGSSVLSFGTAGCNLACKFCQNWDISKAREFDQLCDQATPEQIADAAIAHGCKSVAYTYNDPVIFLEYAVDVATACRKNNISNVAVSAAYVCSEPAKEFFSMMDAANIDLKAFTDEFYFKLCGGHLQPVLDNLLFIYHETDVWLEITTLLIPGKNDGDEELKNLSRWIFENLGPEVPLHFSAFHPDWKMQTISATPAATLQRARKIAKNSGLQHVYTGNIHDSEGGSTYCASCERLLIERDWYQIGAYHLDRRGCCQFCHAPLAGHFGEQAQNWGRRRERVAEFYMNDNQQT